MHDPSNKFPNAILENNSPAESTASGAAFGFDGSGSTEGIFIMGKDPAILFYSDNFLTGTMFFTDDQVGKYMRALCAQHLHGHLTKSQIDSLVKNDIGVMEKFSIDRDGKFYNKRMQKEVERRYNYSLSRSKNRKMSKLTPKTYDEHMYIHMGNGNGNGNEDKNGGEINSGKGSGGNQFYEAFKKAYPLNGSVINPEVLNWFIINTDEYCNGFNDVLKSAEAYATFWKETEPDTYPHCKMMKQAINWLHEAQYEIDWTAKLAAEKRHNEKEAQRRKGGIL